MRILDLSYLETVSGNSVAGGNEMTASSVQVTNINNQVSESSNTPYTREVLPDGSVRYLIGNSANPLTLTLSPLLVQLS